MYQDKDGGNSKLLEDGYRELRGVFFWTKGNSIKAYHCLPDESVSPGDLLHGSLSMMPQNPKTPSID